MKKSTKIITGITALVLSAVLLFVTVITINGNRGNSNLAQAQTRTVELTQSAVDVQSLLNEFDNAKLTKVGTTTYFEGFKSINESQLSNFDYISDSDLDKLEDCITKYNFSYDYESNIVTIAAMAILKDGTVQIDEIKGVGFLSEKNEIDAVMNVDGESVLLSEMRSAGLIENCGWFSKLIKTAAAIVVGAAVVVAAAAAIVVTAGAAAPALVAAGLGITTTAVASGVAAAATIGAYATITAAIAAGVYVAAESIDKIQFNGIDYKAEELTNKKLRNLLPTHYYLTLAASDGKLVYCATPIIRSLAVAVMRANTLVSIYTSKDVNARGITQEAGNFMSPIWDFRHKSGYLNHYHLGNLSDRGNNHSACKSHAFYGLPVD